ncbi:ABC transporter ATP-binding protein [Paenibacillus naphthalenovorans]|uniref:Peptide ABC transporter ATP-binding protein n=1 Tax=Paenibacillus naphthalenovorans TaxID=162209 RepID=A0A0U2USM5_9BACL|nr:ATP-binding cassette domain-containing protein [Paenibacillus naphthalenovorans]ALS24977.1 peptide ABC transporter ATP-binding protein [Paenibacillus naphthalenovorans]GCL74093.1 ABC transporter ATP-binding protein [Paenibacillus naphthalenovorans]SDJ34350.1 peptide/nickel transport system ATP-binding protein [Paenibacillus naphthalenovorans]
MTIQDTGSAEVRRDDLLHVSDLHKAYTAPGAAFRQEAVVKGVSFSIAEGETVGLVGASGAGKSTIGRMIAGLEQPDSGTIKVMGQDILALKGKARRQALRPIQMIFQDPYESLSPRMTIEQLVCEPLVIQRLYSGDKRARRELVREALAEVSLSPDRYMDRYPHELSGGERQRVGLARAFIVRPRLIVADEPTSMLDPSLRLDLLDVMKRLRQRHGLSYLFITHDIALTRHFCDRMLVLEQGVIVESGSTDAVIDDPQHPFTKRLIGALLELTGV